MRREGGYAVFTSPGQAPVERSTFTCAHCNSVKFVNPGERAEDLGGLCKICMGLTCPQCTGHSCAPFEKKLQEMEARHALRSYVEGT